MYNILIIIIPLILFIWFQVISEPIIGMYAEMETLIISVVLQGHKVRRKTLKLIFFIHKSTKPYLLRTWPWVLLLSFLTVKPPSPHTKMKYNLNTLFNCYLFCICKNQIKLSNWWVVDTFKPNILFMKLKLITTNLTSKLKFPNF